MNPGNDPNTAASNGLVVCAYCGATNKSGTRVCPACSMEDTPETRAETGARIGPWFVLQPHNPTAPGMRFSTLLSLVRQGQITPQSIIRGPTTQQFWTFAEKVKGLSRELGLCYACGWQINSNTNQCPRCKKLQEPPMNPDTLLEHLPASVRSASAEQVTPAMKMAIASVSGPDEVAPAPVSQSAQRPEPAPTSATSGQHNSGGFVLDPFAEGPVAGRFDGSDPPAAGATESTPELASPGVSIGQVNHSSEPASVQPIQVEPDPATQVQLPPRRPLTMPNPTSAALGQVRAPLRRAPLRPATAPTSTVVHRQNAGSTAARPTARPAVGEAPAAERTLPPPVRVSIPPRDAKPNSFASDLPVEPADSADESSKPAKPAENSTNAASLQTELQPRSRQIDIDQNLLTPKELAAAFQLEFKPDPRAGQRRAGFARLVGFLGLMSMLAVIAGGLTVIFVPGARERAGALWGWVVEQSRPLRQQTNSRVPAKTDSRSHLERLHDDEYLAAAAAQIRTEDAFKPVKRGPDENQQLAQQLWQDAIEAEQKRDWQTAIKKYQQILTMSQDYWPTSLDNRLTHAKLSLDREQRRQRDQITPEKPKSRDAKLSDVSGSTGRP